MLTKRVIVCLDVRNKKVTKGVKFKGNIDLGDPVDMGAQYYHDGVDELVFYDITASAENRSIDIEMVKGVAENVFIPFSVGGGIRNLDDMRDVLLAGAEKVSVNSLAVQHPEIIRDGAKAFGNQCIVLGMDAKKTDLSSQFPSGYEIYINGGRKAMGIDAVEWAKKAVDLGAGEICLNAIDTDGVKNGYELTITKMVADAVPVPVIASGGAGVPSHLAEVLTKANADAALIASMVHFGTYTIEGIKKELKESGVSIRESWSL
ncbi:MAG: imidazole glycerol phosphate synthase subunit HisF [Fibrobacteria bacterium]|nr:imidazole glycerol phosphate synthase subunit HisF [Fibrobacteria bacterium]